MKDFHLRVGAVVLFSLFAATSGAFAATGGETESSADGAALEMDSDKQSHGFEASTYEPILESTHNADPLVSNPAELQKCLTACKAGGAVMLSYCNVLALGIVAAGGSFVACSGFCYARFVD